MPLTQKQFLQQRAAVRGGGNPQRMDVPLWEELVRSGETAHAAATGFVEPELSSLPKVVDVELLLAFGKVKAATQAWAPGVPGQWPGQMDLLTACQRMGPGEACILVLLGVVYLMFGYSIFRALVTLNAMAAGAYLGALMGRNSNALAAGAMIGAIIAAAVTFPLMKYAVMIMGGIFGAALGASLWRQAGLQPELAWAGALSGLIFFGMLALVIFRGSVILYTSLQGAVMLVFGILSLLYKYQSMAPDVTDVFVKRAFILPTVVLIPALVGLLYQQSMYPAAPAAASSGPKK